LLDQDTLFEKFRPVFAMESGVAGARWLAVSSVVCAADDPETATRRLVQLIANAAQGGQK